MLTTHPDTFQDGKIKEIHISSNWKNIKTESTCSGNQTDPIQYAQVATQSLVYHDTQVIQTQLDSNRLDKTTQWFSTSL